MSPLAQTDQGRGRTWYHMDPRHMISHNLVEHNSVLSHALQIRGVLIELHTMGKL